MKEYNGWPNRETWTVSLYCTSLEDVKAAKEWLEEIEAGLPLIAMDLFGWAMAEVDWHYLEQAFAPTDAAAANDDNDDNDDTDTD